MSQSMADAAAPDVEWALFDSVDQCWIGTNDAGTGPRTWRDRAIANASEQLAGVMFDYPHGRLEVRAYDGSGTQQKDEITAPRTAAEAMDLLGWLQCDAFDTEASTVDPGCDP